jgi:hypothetical protein
MHPIGDTPVYLIVRAEGVDHVIDLDEKDWADRNPVTKGPGTWVLCGKRPGPNQGSRVAMVVAEGDKPNYVAKHIGAMAEGAVEILCYGLVKEAPDGARSSVWLMPNGMSVSGDDVYAIGADIVHMRI